MSNIRGKNTSIELQVFRALRKRGLYFQKHYHRVSGSPDIALPRLKKAVFIDGDFWHGWKYSSTPRIRKNKYWGPKIKANINRDRRNRRKLRLAGWEILRIWEHEIEKDFQSAFKRIVKFLISY